MPQSTDSTNMKTDDILKLTSEIVAAYVRNNPVPAAEVPAMIKSVHATLGGLAANAQSDGASAQKPAISIKRSITPEYIVCLEDGKKLKMLKRHLMTHYSLTPDQYRQKWGLAADYPMVAPNYAEQRRSLAKSIGLGTKRRTARGGK